MSTLADQARARDLRVTDTELTVFLADGRTVSVPLDWFPRLKAATPAQRENWRLLGQGIGIHWPQIDEDISIEGLLRPEGTARAKR
jgi:hypothetical protein